MLKYLPSSAGNAFTGTQSAAEILTYGQGVAVFLAWLARRRAAVPAAALMRRDA